MCLVDVDCVIALFLRRFDTFSAPASEGMPSRTIELAVCSGLPESPQCEAVVWICQIYSMHR